MFKWKKAPKVDQMSMNTENEQKDQVTKASATESEIPSQETLPTPPPGIQGAEIERWRTFEQDKLFPVTQAAFTTQRLAVYSYKIRIRSDNLPRTVFLGFDIDCEFPLLIVSATVWLKSPYIGNNVEWIEVIESHKRAGFATEFWHGLKEHLGGELIGTPVTESGHGFYSSLQEQKSPVSA